MRQLILAQQAEFQGYATKTRWKQLLEEIEAVMPWTELWTLIGTNYPKSEIGGKSMGLEVVRRIYSLQEWFALSAPRVEDAEYEAPVLRGIAVIGSPRTILERQSFASSSVAVL